eukprot:scaffold1640_cov161-Amphora_coffeaeformis.AAC.35
MLSSSDPDDPLSFLDISLDDDPAPSPVPAAPPSVPSPPPPPKEAAPGTTVLTSITPRFLRWMIHLGLLVDSPSSWELSFQQMQSTYQEHVQAHPYPVGEDEATVGGDKNAPAQQQLTSSENNSLDLDPLSAIVRATESEEKQLAEMDLQYRKEKALRNRGKGTARMLPESEEYDEEFATLQVIDKDLARLANPHNNDNTEKEAARQEMLRQILFVYHCENTDPGYRQGMHEIASYLLFALELDISDAVKSSYQAPLTYHLLAQVLQGMAAAFDIQNGGSAGSALQTIGRRVDYAVRTHDPLLGQRLAKLQVPPQMYFTKWIRLLFAREVTEVLEFWDEAFFGTPVTAQNFMPLLEAWTAARLLIWSAHFMSIRDEGQLLQTLMNLPVEPETHIWSQVARDILKRTPSIVVPANNHEFRPPLASLPPPTPAMPVSSPPPRLHGPPLAAAAAVAPFKSFLAEAGTVKHLGGWMEQLTTKTHILGQRVKQEWEHIAAATNPENIQSVYQPPPVSRRAAEEGINYNITYRREGEEPPLYDPPVPAPAPPPMHAPSSRPLTRNVICKRMDQSTATLHAYLMQQQTTSNVPSTVWQALADLQKLSQELRPRVNQN